MPQPKKKPAPAPSREHVRSLLNPVDAVLLTRDRLQEIVDDAVRRGRMTRTDAADLMQEIFTRGRRTTEDLLTEVDTLLGSPSDRVRRMTGIGSGFPIAGYENLTAAQVQERLADLAPAQLRKLRDYERRNANRKTVLAAIETQLSS